MFDMLALEMVLIETVPHSTKLIIMYVLASSKRSKFKFRF